MCACCQLCRDCCRSLLTTAQDKDPITGGGTLRWEETERIIRINAGPLPKGWVIWWRTRFKRGDDAPALEEGEDEDDLDGPSKDGPEQDFPAPTPRRLRGWVVITAFLVWLRPGVEPVKGDSAGTELRWPKAPKLVSQMISEREKKCSAWRDSHACTFLLNALSHLLSSA